MDNNEHAIFLDIPSGGKNGKYHSAVLTTYAIDLIHFDRQLLNILHRKQICSINVLVDYDQMEKSMEYINPIYMKNIGKEYCVTNIIAKKGYVFHPKINFFIGDESVMVLIGSGNLTVPGHGKNHEVFTGFMIDENDCNHQPLIEECWQYLKRFETQFSDFVKFRILHEIPDNCRFLKSPNHVEPHKMYDFKKGLSAALLYNEANSTILQQLKMLISLEDVKKVTVVSPYFDERGDSLITLSKWCPNAKIKVLIHRDCSLPPCKMTYNKNIDFYDFSNTKRSQIKIKKYERKLHAKIIHFELDNQEYCLIGSANATKPGLGLMVNNESNEEFCVLYRSEKKHILRSLGLISKNKLEISKVRNMKRTELSESSDTNCSLRIISAHYENEKLNVCLDNEIPTGTLLAVNSGTEVTRHEPSDVKNKILVLDTKLSKNDQLTCYFINEKEERISNIVFINWIELLERTNPSKTSRSLNRFISRIENEGYDGMEVAGILSDIMTDLFNEQNNRISTKIKTSSGGQRNHDSGLPDIEYREEYDNGETRSKHIVHIDRTSRLIECIEDSIKRKIHSIDDAILEEEEEGKPEISNNRDYQKLEDIVIKRKSIPGFGDLSASILKNYRTLLRKRREQVQQTGDNVITKDDMNFFSLSIFAAIEICYLNRCRYQYDGLDSLSRSSNQRIFERNLDSSISCEGIQALREFASFCQNKNLPNGNSDTITKRTMKYAILFGSLFFHIATESDTTVYGTSVTEAIKKMTEVFNLPNNDYLYKELSPLSERYDNVFSMKHINSFINKLNHMKP
jgi:hypothetical protein